MLKLICMELKINNQSYQIVITKKNIKHLYIRIKDSNIISITCSKRFTDTMIKNYLNDNILSIKNMIDHHIKKNNKDSQFYYLGNPYQIVYNSSIKQVIIENNMIYATNESVLNKWLLMQMKAISHERFAYWLSMIKPPVSNPTLKFRSMTSRWGVCNRLNHSVTLNSKLIRYPLAVIDYVIIHELCHFMHPHHQPDFWQEVSSYCPDYKVIRKILKE